MSISPQIIAVANRKGGTGKTTTTVNLAAEWGQQGKRTLLVDLDTQGHAAIGLGCSETRQQGENIHQLFYEPDKKLMDLVTPTVAENVFLAPADTNFNIQEHMVDTLLLSNKLTSTEVAESFDRIIIDTPPTMDAMLVSALVAATGVVIPFVPHHLAEVGVRQLAKLFYQVATRHNVELKLLGLLPVMFDRHIKLHQRVVDELARQFGSQRIMRGIRANIKLAEAFEAGKPVNQFAPRCPGAMDYQLMAEALEVV